VRAARFVIVELPVPDTPLAGFTARNPGCAIDLISEPAAYEGFERFHPSLVLVRGAEPQALDELLARLRKVYDRVETLERNDERRSWLGRMRLREAAYTHNAGLRVLTSFQHRYGAPWTHLEQGTLHLRARVPDEGGADVLVDQMRRYFEREGVDAQVEVRDLSAKDYGVWEDLVERAIGLSP
jgi:hypothetical protein